MATSTRLPQLMHIIETILYTKDIERARHFYGHILQLTPLPSMSSPRSQGYQLGQTNLLIFALGKTTEDLVSDESRPDMIVPRHGPTENILKVLLDGTEAPVGAASESLRQHFCFATNTEEDVKQWEQYLAAQNVPILSRMEWERGGYSVYFEDPDGHVGEILSRGLWPNWI